MNQQLFHKVCDDVIGQQPGLMGVGTLGEKTVHSVLKNYYDTNDNNHEIKIDGFIADICNGNEIIEIQTRSFDRLRKTARIPGSLSCNNSLSDSIYKWIRWVDPQTGEITPPRKSPKKGTPYSIFPELYKIKNYLLIQTSD